MFDHLVNSIASIVTAIIGVAFLAVIVSKNANTSGIINASSSGLAQDLSAAEAPVTNSSASLPSLDNFETGQF